MSDSINELAAALAKAQARIEGATKDGLNPHFRSRYATLASVWDAARAPLGENGLSVVQGTSADGATVKITTLLLHASGQWIEDVLTLTAQQDTPQGVGSAISYGRRYGLSAMVGVTADSDDDAEAAQGRGVQKQPALVKPDGYDVWLKEIEGVIPEGIDVLRARYKVAPSIYRDYLAKDTKTLEGMKAAAQAVTNLAKAQKVPA
jgi:ERF superfamily